MSTNVTRLQNEMKNRKIPAILVSDIVNVQWLTGFSGSSGYALVTQDSGAFITDSRYTIQAQVEVSDLEVRWYSSATSLEEFLLEVAQGLKISDLKFEDSISYAISKKWQESFKGISMSPADDILKSLRMIKTPDEVARIKRACELADQCLQHVTRMLQPGVSEFDIDLDIEFFFRRNGATASFSPIVASGPNSAKPHAHATERKLEKGDFVTLDLGAKLDGYCSDITRTFVIGEASDRHREIYDQVLAAQEASIHAIKPGTPCKDVDAVARQVLAQRDLAQYFGHGLGHGLGRAVHDPGSLSLRSADTVAAGQVWTVEPGVYIDGFGGVRIEDDVFVTEQGPEILTSFPKGLTVLS